MPDVFYLQEMISIFNIIGSVETPDLITEINK